MSAVWQLPELRPIHHRIIWWLIDAGALGVTPARGWREQCAEDLKVHRQTIYRNINKMIAWGVMSEGAKRGEAVLNKTLFNRHVDRNKVKLKGVSETQ